MSADSQKRVGGGTIIGAANRPTVVPPQAVSDRSIIESVAGFINDVTLANTQQHDVKDHILWVRFETAADLSDPCAGDDWDLEGGVAPPLLLILGYSNGIQVWAVPANGEAIEVLSWRHGNVKCLRILPTPVVADCEQSTGGEAIDQYAHKRPLIAICDSATHQQHLGGGGGGYHGGGDGMGGLNGTQHCSMNLVSLKDGDQVKSIKFKTPIIDILANRSSIVVTFLEKIAVFDARTLEDRLTVTTCFASPGLNPNPVALGSRWMAYAEKKLLPSKRSNGGCDCGGVQSYTATMLNAAKSLGKGLRELGEHVAAGLTGQPSSSMGSGNTGPNAAGGVGGLDAGVGGIVTILDVKYPIRDISPTTGTPITTNGNEAIIAHFIAHTDPIVALAFDFSGMLLLTADKRGHNFHIFRIHPHPSGAALAAVHHLYVLHRGDTTAKVQDIAFSMDSRWVAVSTMRGTTHIFPVTSYGGPAGVRTHATPHVVNRLSRFHRSAGLSIETGRSSSPVSFSGGGGSDHYSSSASIAQSAVAYQNPRQPPFPHPTVVLPLAQIRQPTSLGNTGAGGGGPTGGPTSHKLTHSRQRHSSTSDDALGNPLRVAAYFAKDRSWLLDPPGLLRDTPAHRMQRRPVDSLFIMAGHGALIQYDLDPRHASNIPKEKVCDDTPIELDVVAKAQWHLQRTDYQRTDIQPPLLPDNWLIKNRLIDSMMESSGDSEKHHHSLDSGHHERDDRWLAQVEIMTHAGPHRRLWMGPQFMFKTYNTPSGSPLTAIDIESVEIGASIVGNRPARSNPMNMPGSGRSLVPVLIESGSCSSFEQSPRLMDTFRHEHLDSDFVLGPGESQLREDLADAMREPTILSREIGGVATATTLCASSNPTTMTISLTSISSDSSAKTSASRSIAKLVNPLGTVTTVTANPDDDMPEVHDFETSDRYLHENCDEALFRPVVTVMDVAIEGGEAMPEAKPDIPKQASVATELIVPVIDETYVEPKKPVEKYVEPKKPVEAVVVEKKKKSPPPEAKAIEKFEQMAALNRKVDPKEEPGPRKLSKGEKEKKPVDPEPKKMGKGKKEKTPPPKEEKQPTPPPKPEVVEEKPFEKETTPEAPKPVPEKEVVTSVSIKLPSKKANKKNRKEEKQAVAVVEEPAPVKVEEKVVEQPPAEVLPPIVKSVWDMASPFNIATQLDAAISEEDIPDAVGAWGQPKKSDFPSPVFDDFPSLQPLDTFDKPEPVSPFDFKPPPPPKATVEEEPAPPTQLFFKLTKKPKKGKDPKPEVEQPQVEDPEVLDLPPPLEEVGADEEPELIQLPAPPKPTVAKKTKGEEEEYAFFNPDELVSIQESLFKDNAISLKKSGKASKAKEKPQFGLPSKSDEPPRSKYEFVETDPFPPLEPLSPFAKMSFKDVIEDAILTADTLINLHSPDREESGKEEDASGSRKKTISSSSSIYEDPANLVLCSGLQSSTAETEDDKASKTSSENKGSGSSGGSGDAPDSDYKSLDLEIDEHYLDLESGAEGGGFMSSDENNKDSSDDTEDLSCRSKKALVPAPSLRRNNSTSSSDENIVVVEQAATPPDVAEPSPSTMQGAEDEELEPLISNVTTPSSTASPNLSTKAMINDTLPDALLTTMTTSLTISSGSQQLPAGSKQQQQQSQPPPSQQSSSGSQKMPVTSAAASSNSNNNNNNGKKKSRTKKKR